MSETLMGNGTRRLLAHLSTPHTVDGLAARLHADPYVGAVDVEQELEDLLDRGWVVSLEPGQPEDVVAQVNDDDDAVGFGRGQAKIWQARAEAGRVPHLEGAFYVLSKDGLAALQGTDDAEEADE